MPDVMVAAKPLGCGLPLGSVSANEHAASAIRPGMHGSTFGGGALACRVALEFFDILDELLPSIRSTGDYFRERLRDLATQFGTIKEVRGSGLMIGVEMTAPAKVVVAECMAQGLLINCTHDVVLRFLPPYIITEKEVDRAVAILAKVLKGFRPGEQSEPLP
jgi:acetylornithine/succinyldiaminopimelate/putrescine aminotransferase